MYEYSNYRWILLIVQGYAEYLFARQWTFRENNSRFRTVKAGNAALIGLQAGFGF